MIPSGDSALRWWPWPVGGCSEPCCLFSSLGCCRLFGGLIQDIRRKAHWYRSDFSDAMHIQCLSAVLYIYLATVTNAITFGGMLGDATANMQVSVPWGAKLGMDCAAEQWGMWGLPALLRAGLPGECHMELPAHALLAQAAGPPLAVPEHWLGLSNCSAQTLPGYPGSWYPARTPHSVLQGRWLP